MNRREYQELLIDALTQQEDFQRIEVPTDQQPGENETEAWLRWMAEQDMIEFDEFNSLVIKDAKKIKEFDPNMLKILNVFIKADTYARLDMMEEAGIIYTSVDDDGNIVRIVASTGDVVYLDEDDEE